MTASAVVAPAAVTPELRTTAAGAALGLVAATLIFAGLVTAGFLPPPSPHDGALEIAHRYARDATRIRTGVALAAAGSFLLVGWYAAVAATIRRIEGERRTLTYAWLIAAAGSLMDFVLPLLFLEAAAFRQGDPQLVRAFNDLGWLCFLAAPYIFSLQATVLGVAVLQDRRPAPLLPRWFGFTSLWCALVFLPGVLIVFFKTGPVAWNGVLAWWLPLVAFGAWVVAASVLVMRGPEA